MQLCCIGMGCGPGRSRKHCSTGKVEYRVSDGRRCNSSRAATSGALHPPVTAQLPLACLSVRQTISCWPPNPFAQCVELKRDWPKGYSRLGAAYFGLEEWEEAVKAYEDGGWGGASGHKAGSSAPQPRLGSR